MVAFDDLFGIGRGLVLAQLASQAASRLALPAEAIHMLCRLFDPLAYQDSVAGVDFGNDCRAAFAHFLAEGYVSGRRFSHHFDAELVAQAIGMPRAEPLDVLKRWLTDPEARKRNPSRFFDPGFYLDRHPDIAAAGVDPFEHFIGTGCIEGRFSAPWQERVVEAFFRAGRSVEEGFASLRAIMRRIHPAAASLLSAPGEERANALFLMQPSVYLARHEVGQGGENPEGAFWHYVQSLAGAPTRASGLFNDRWYRRAWQEYVAGLARDRDGKPRLPASTAWFEAPLEPHHDAFLHFLGHGRLFAVVPTPLFDEGLYLRSHPDLARLEGWAFQHFAGNGVFEQRKASGWFDAVWYRRIVPEPQFDSPLLDYLFRGEAEGLMPHPWVNVATLRAAATRAETALERLAWAMDERSRSIRTPQMQALIARAAEIEPMIMPPGEVRELVRPPFRHSAVHLLAISKAMEAALGGRCFRRLVFIPHVRMSGAARVAGELIRAMAEAWGPESILVVVTDLDVVENPQWFPPGVEWLSLARIAAGAHPEIAMRAAIDLIRGVEAEQVVNVNSKLCWDLFSAYGRQLSQEADLYAYLFTWDLDASGNKRGYPVNYFERCFDNLSAVLIDNHRLRDELAARFMLPPPLAERLVVAHTPFETGDVAHGQTREIRPATQGLRCFWASRMDRQKRFDLVVAIAELMPELEILVWGQAVLDRSPLDDDRPLPANIRLMGTYVSADEIPFAEIDFHLYTSQWDGLPTSLIDFALRAIPIVASNVGGVPELIDAETGWLVDDVLEPRAYVAAIRAMAADPRAAATRAAALRGRVMALCDRDAYRRVVERTLNFGERRAGDGG